MILLNPAMKKAHFSPGSENQVSKMAGADPWYSGDALTGPMYRSFYVGGGGEKFVFARRGNLGFVFEKLLVAPQRRIAAAFSPIHFFI